MNIEDTVAALAGLGVPSDGLEQSNREFLKIACPLARWTHADGTDARPSATVHVTGQGRASWFECFACLTKRSLTGLALQLYRHLDAPEDMLPLLDWIRAKETPDYEALFGELATRFSGAPAVTTAPLPTGAVVVEAVSSRRLTTEEKRLRHQAQQEIVEEDVLHLFATAQPHEYWFSRGGTLAEAARWEVGFDKQQKRLTLPVRRRDGRLVGLTGRAVVPKKHPKYYHYWNYKKGKFLFGEHKLAEIPKISGVALLEGPFDVIAADRAFRAPDADAFFGRFVALGVFGASLSEPQAQLVLGLNAPIYLFLDNDETGYEGMRRMGLRLSESALVFRVNYDVLGERAHEVKDAGDLTHQEIYRLLDTAEPVTTKKARGASREEA